MVTEGIRQRLLARGQAAEKLVLIPNGANTELFQPEPALGAEFRRQHGLRPDDFVVAYAGIHGIAQGLETVLYAAQVLRNSAGIRFVMIGEGPVKVDLQQLRAELSLDNVLMLPEQPRASMPAALSAADVALVPLRNVELFEHAVPSKLFDAWACGCPVLLSIGGEARRIMETANGGLYVPPEDSTALAGAINQLAKLPDRGRSLGANGRRFTEEHYSRQAQARQLERLLLQVVVHAF